MCCRRATGMFNVNLLCVYSMQQKRNAKKAQKKQSSVIEKHAECWYCAVSSHLETFGKFVEESFSKIFLGQATYL